MLHWSLSLLLESYIFKVLLSEKLLIFLVITIILASKRWNNKQSKKINHYKQLQNILCVHTSLLLIYYLCMCVCGEYVCMYECIPVSLCVMYECVHMVCVVCICMHVMCDCVSVYV